MPRFCGKCGSKLDEKTGLCPNCSVDRIDSEIENQNLDYDSFEDERFEARGDNEPKSKGVFSILTTIASAVVLSCLIVCLLTYFDVLDIDFVNDIFISTGVKEYGTWSVTRCQDEDGGKDGIFFDIQKIGDDDQIVSSENHDETNSENQVYVKPVFNNIAASSVLAAVGKDSYSAENLRYDDSTCWCEGVNGSCVGEYVLFSSPD